MSNDDADFKDASGSSVDRVAVRLPPFWPEDPEVWFVQAEAQFLISGIKEDTTKFYQVISQLDQRYIKEIKDVVKNPPPTGKYEKLKLELTKRLSISRERQITQLLSHEELGDRKPSQFLRHLKTLAAGEVSDDFLRSLWANRLPPFVRGIIASRTSGSLEDAAELADQIYEITPVCQVASTSAVPIESNNFDDLLKRLENSISSRIQTELKQQIAQLSLRSRGRTPTRRRFRSRSRGKTPGVCWYHNNFGDKARKCISPCNYNTVNRHDSL